MRVTSIQLEIKDQSKKDAVRHTLDMLDSAPPSDLVLLPEIWPSGFFRFDRYKKESEAVDGPLVRTLQRKAVDLGCHLFTGSFVEREGDGYYNTSLLLSPEGEILGGYRKIHLFGYQSEEKRLLTRGSEPAVLKTPWGLTGLCTCYDLRFPELFRKMVTQGAEFFLVASAWPLVRLDAWTLFNRARAHENLAFLFSCNCAGSNEGSRYAGHSMFVNPLGEVITEADDRGCILSKEVDPDLVKDVRKEFPALNDRVFS